MLRSPRFWPAAASLLAVLAAVQVLSIRQESQTWDEGIEIAVQDRRDVLTLVRVRYAEPADPQTTV